MIQAGTFAFSATLRCEATDSIGAGVVMIGISGIKWLDRRFVNFAALHSEFNIKKTCSFLYRFIYIMKRVTVIDYLNTSTFSPSKLANTMLGCES